MQKCGCQRPAKRTHVFKVHDRQQGSCRLLERKPRHVPLQSQTSERLRHLLMCAQGQRMAHINCPEKDYATVTRANARKANDKKDRGRRSSISARATVRLSACPTCCSI